MQPWRLKQKQSIGSIAEALAERYLKKNGLKLIARNYRCKSGEIDLIMRDHDTIVFIEVRLRSNPDYASALESVTAAKQQRIIKAASHYLLSHPDFASEPCRFDVVAIDKTDRGNQINWIKHAFEVNY